MNIKLVLSLNGKDVEIPIEEAEKLYRVLDGMFGKKDTTYPYQIPYTPVYPYGPTYYWYSDSTGGIQSTFTVGNS